MASKKGLEALQKTDVAIKSIHSKLSPFLKYLQENEGVDFDSEEQKKYDDRTVSRSMSRQRRTSAADRKRRALAQSTVALSLGTLRYMGYRLRGLDRGRKADDPLRKELNRMRKVLVTLQRKGMADKRRSNTANEAAKQMKILKRKGSPNSSAEKESKRPKLPP